MTGGGDEVGQTLEKAVRQLHVRDDRVFEQALADVAEALLRLRDDPEPHYDGAQRAMASTELELRKLSPFDTTLARAEIDRALLRVLLRSARRVEEARRDRIWIVAVAMLASTGIAAICAWAPELHGSAARNGYALATVPLSLATGIVLPITSRPLLPAAPQITPVILAQLARGALIGALWLVRLAVPAVAVAAGVFLAGARADANLGVTVSIAVFPAIYLMRWVARLTDGI